MNNTSDRPVVAGSPEGAPAYQKWVNRGALLILAFFLVVQIIVRTVELPFGQSLVRYTTYIMIVLLTVLGLVWTNFGSGWSKRTTRTITFSVLGAIALAASMVRGWSWDGDSWLSFEWRWQPTAAERLEAYRNQAGSGSGTSVAITEVTESDMPAYRGINRDGLVIGPKLIEDWSKAPPRVVWKHAVGGGYAQPVVIGQQVITIEQRREQEVVASYDAATGLEQWAYEYPGRFYEALGGEGPRATPVVHGDKVYTLGALGHLACLDRATGRKIWSRELLQELKVSNLSWGITSSPLVDEDRLVVNVGATQGAGLLAVRLEDGVDVWQAEGLRKRDQAPELSIGDPSIKAAEAPAPDREHAPAEGSSGGKNLGGYASPVLATVDGVLQIINLDGRGLWGHDRLTGKILWFYHFENSPGVNAAQPIFVDGNRILISASYGEGSHLVEVRKEGERWTTNKVWANRKSLESKMSSPALIDGLVYGFDEGFFACLDPETGKAKWMGSREYPSRGKYGHGQMLVTNGLIVVLTERGEVALVRPRPDKLEELIVFPVLEGEKTWNAPALVNGRLYIRNHYEMACVDMIGTTEAPASPAAPSEGTVQAALRSDSGTSSGNSSESRSESP